MSTLVQQICDSPEMPGHPATTRITATIGETTMSMDACDKHRDELVRLLTNAGMQPTHTRVGKDIRGAYVSATGLAFTARDVREWLQKNGHDTLQRGRLAAKDITAYADAH